MAETTICANCKQVINLEIGIYRKGDEIYCLKCHNVIKED